MEERHSALGTVFIRNQTGQRDRRIDVQLCARAVVQLNGPTSQVTARIAGDLNELTNISTRVVIVQLRDGHTRSSGSRRRRQRKQGEHHREYG